MKQEEKRRKRQDELQGFIKDSNFGGRGVPTAIYRQNQLAQQEKERKEKEELDRKKFI